MKYYFAPVQGHTDAAYRHFHSAQYDGDIIYTTPFIRLEHGELRKKDFKDATSPLNEGVEVIPQVIFKNAEELLALVEIIKAEGMKRIDINMGCPFPLQTSRGRGAASLQNEECREAVKQVITDNPDLSFSVKIRLGYDSQQWQPLLSTLSDLKIDHLAVHPRTARDQYTPGTLNLDAFRQIYESTDLPLVYNGDILTPADAERVMQDFPNLAGLMIGRGALGRPSLLTEIITGKELSPEKRLQQMLQFHRTLAAHYRETLVGGDHQVLSKLQPFWEYAEAEIGRKAWKAIRKASTMAKYQTALALIGNDL